MDALKEAQYMATCSQLYQVIGHLLDETDLFDTESGRAALDLAGDGANGEPMFRRGEILPWPYVNDKTRGGQHE